MTGYTRQEVFSDGDVILAEHGNNELNQVEGAFQQATGHKHDGTAAEGAYVPLISDPDNTDKVEIVAGGARTTGTHQVTGLLTADSGLSVTGNISVTGTVDGRDVAADGTKLDGVEAGATADQNAAEVAFTPTGDLASTDVQAALAELDSEKAPSSHVGAGGGAHPDATTSVSGFLSAADKTKLDTLTPATSSGITDASLLPFTPAGGIEATDTQAAIEELDTEKQELLVSGTNIKTVGGVSLLGSGDVTAGALVAITGAVPFAAVSSIEVDLSTTYSSFVLILRNLTTSGGAQLEIQLDLAGVLQTTGYYGSGCRIDGGTLTGPSTIDASEIDTNIDTSLTHKASLKFDILAKAPQPSLHWSGTSGNTTTAHFFGSGWNTGAAAATSITIAPASGTMSGNYALFGVVE